MRDTPVLPVIEPVLGESPEVLRWQFIRSLRASKLLPAEDIDLLDRETAEARAEDIQQMLLDQELLTAYQLRRVRDGSPGGLVLGPYRILDEIGSGGFGQVYKATHTVLDRVVALKLMAPAQCPGRQLREVFRRELAAVTRLNHPNVATTFDANEIDGTLFMAMEFVEGPTLHALVDDNGPPPLDLAVSIMAQAARGLQHAHERGLVHRDVKPANMLVTGSVWAPGAADAPPVLVKVIDFGLARMYPQNNRPAGTLLADAGAIVGTPAFMAPEQARNFHDADSRSDLYSLGCTFYYLLTGEIPFASTSARATLVMHATNAVVPIRDLRPEVPPGLAAVVHRLLAKRPEDRYQSAAELCTALSDFAPLDFAPHHTPRPERSESLPLAQTCAPSDALAPTTVEPERATPTDPPGRPVLPSDLLRLWLEWCVVVETLARSGPLGISDTRYSELYRALLAALRTSKTADTTLSADQYERLAGAVEPWVTLKALAGLSREEVAQLWQTCRELDSFYAPVPGSKRPSLTGRGLRVAVVCGLAAGAVWIASNWSSVVSTVTAGAR